MSEKNKRNSYNKTTHIETNRNKKTIALHCIAFENYFHIFAVSVHLYLSVHINLMIRHHKCGFIYSQMFVVLLTATDTDTDVRDSIRV